MEKGERAEGGRLQLGSASDWPVRLGYLGNNRHNWVVLWDVCDVELVISSQAANTREDTVKRC